MLDPRRHTGYQKLLYKHTQAGANSDSHSVEIDTLLVRYPFYPLNPQSVFFPPFRLLPLFGGGGLPVATPPKVPGAEKQPSEFTAAWRQHFLALISLP